MPVDMTKFFFKCGLVVEGACNKLSCQLRRYVTANITPAIDVSHQNCPQQTISTINDVATNMDSISCLYSLT
jgi:molybdopterin/thiamine biosynthesis adenylyltransferase